MARRRSIQFRSTYFETNTNVFRNKLISQRKEAANTYNWTNEGVEVSRIGKDFISVKLPQIFNGISAMFAGAPNSTFWWTRA